MKQDESTPEGVAEAPPRDEGKWLPRPLILGFAATALVLAAALSVFLLTAERPTSGTGGSAGTPDIGGPFELVDQTGRTVTQADFAGKYMLIYFGFTYCPDVCPTALQVISTALDSLGERAKQVQPIFITVDPERDTPENMAAYVQHFSDRLVGLTGTPEQIRKAADAYKVVYKTARYSGESDYLMEHTSYIYLMGPDGKFATYFDIKISPEEMADGIAKAMR